jgi:hypothetical protein
MHDMDDGSFAEAHLPKPDTLAFRKVDPAYPGGRSGRAALQLHDCTVQLRYA